MKQEGRWLIQTSQKPELDWFIDMYNMNVYKLIKDYQLERFEVDKKAFVFLEYDGSVNKIIRLLNDDKAVVYGEGCYNLPFNTDGIAVLEVYDSETQVTTQWVVENSPYELQPASDLDFDEYSDWDEMGKEAEDYIDDEPLLNGLTVNQVTFVRQL